MDNSKQKTIRTF